jgi:hypothetical protein
MEPAPAIRATRRPPARLRRTVASSQPAVSTPLMDTTSIVLKRVVTLMERALPLPSSSDRVRVNRIMCDNPLLAIGFLANKDDEERRLWLQSLLDH